MRESWRFRLAMTPALLAIACTVVSDITTDRWSFAQSIWWIPRLPLALAALVWMVGVTSYARWRVRDFSAAKRGVRWSACALLFVLFQLFFMYGIPSARPSGALRIVHWNASFIEEEFADDAVRQLIELDGDAIVLTDAGTPVLSHGLERFTAAGYTMARPGRFTLLSREPIIEASPILASRSRYVSSIRLATHLGPLSIEAIDLPSTPSIPRAILMRSLAADLASVRSTLPELFIGDFNITRGSFSLTLLADDAVEAFATAGTGWGGTFPRTKPFWSIDLALVRKPWIPLRSDIVDFGFGRHRVQVVDLARQDTAPAQ